MRLPLSYQHPYLLEPQGQLQWEVYAMVKAGKRDVTALKEGLDEIDLSADSDSVLDDVDELIMYLDSADPGGAQTA